MAALESKETAAPASWQRPGREGPKPDGEERSWQGRRRWPMPVDGERPAGSLPTSSLSVWTGSAGYPLGTIPVTARAAIGDDLRRPALWCELGACISRFSDGSALGEQDNRRRALAAGWRQDAFGRWLCPGCMDRHPYWNAQPLIPRRAVLAEPGVWQTGQHYADPAEATVYPPSARSGPPLQDDAEPGKDQVAREPEQDDDVFWRRERSGRHRRRSGA